MLGENGGDLGKKQKFHSVRVLFSKKRSKELSIEALI